MLTLLSPAKTLDFETAVEVPVSTQPDFLDDSANLIDALLPYSPEELGALMKLSPALSELNVQRYHDWQVPYPVGQAKASLLAFKGDVYTGLQAETMNASELTYAQDHVRILSGLYGLLRPLDDMLPYRLEMGTKLNNSAGKDLYAFWGDKLTNALNELVEKEGHKWIVNLASNEYFKAIKPKQLNAELITPVFKDEKNGQYKIISFYAKKARGMMAGYQIREQVEDIEGLKAFNEAGYRFSEEDSKGGTLVFKRAEKDVPKK